MSNNFNPINETIYNQATTISRDEALQFAEQNIEIVKYLCALKRVDNAKQDTTCWSDDVEILLNLD